MNVLKEGKTYYLSSMNSQFPLIPCDEALQYLKLPLQNDLMCTTPAAAFPFSPVPGIPPEMMGSYSPSNGYYSLPLPMVPIHTQSVLYPTMQYFPPLCSVTSAPSDANASDASAYYDGSGVKLEENEYPSDSSDEEGFDYSSVNPDIQNHPSFMAMMQQQLSSECSSTPLHYEFTLPYQCYPVFPSSSSGSPSSNLLTMNTSTIPVVLTTTVDMGTNGTSSYLSENMGTLLTETSSVLLKRTRDEYESNHPLNDQHQPDTYMMTPSVLPPFSNNIA